jgi:fibronectin type 3 domain-containing protein
VAAAPGNGQLVVTWTAPASDGGSTITDYVATSSPGGAACSTTGATVCTMGGLTNGTAYTVTVTAANTAGIGPASVPVSATPATVPSAPNGLVATRGNGQVSLTWSAPTSNGGSAVTGYTATASPGGATCAVGDTTFACVIGGLTNGTSYSFTVTATNAIGTGPESAPASATPATVPGAPTNLLATPGNAQVSLTWSAPASNGGSAVTGYTATASPGGSTCSVDGTTFACTIGGLTNGISYTVTVTATNAVGTGAPSAPASATPVASATAPGAPTNLAATPGNGQVALTWSAPASNGGSPITGYTATASPGGATCSTSGALTCTVAGLTNGTAYTFTVRATNAVGQGPASGSVAATPRTVPTAPRNLDAKTASPKGVRLTWLAPTSNGGAAITGYKIYRGTSSGTETWLIDLGVVTTFTDTGTTAGTRYYYRVVAVNAAGPGPQSNEANARAK